MERVAGGQKLDSLGMDMRRYQLPSPSHGRLTDPTAWQQSLDNSRAQLEQQRTRFELRLTLCFIFSGVNLDWLEAYGAETYRRSNSVLESQMKMAEKVVTNLNALCVFKELGQLHSTLTQMHMQRKRDQTKAGEQLTSMDHEYVMFVVFLLFMVFRWVGLVTKNYAIEQRCSEMESEINALERKRFRPS
jgi:pre-mRNA-splicing factor SPF27